MLSLYWWPSTTLGAQAAVSAIFTDWSPLVRAVMLIVIALSPVRPGWVSPAVNVFTPEPPWAQQVAKLFVSPASKLGFCSRLVGAGGVVDVGTVVVVGATTGSTVLKSSTVSLPTLCTYGPHAIMSTPAGMTGVVAAYWVKAACAVSGARSCQ